MINKNFSQKGSAHVVIIAILVVALLGTLGFVFWQNFMNKDTSDTNNSNDSSTTQTGDKERNKKTPVLINEDGYSFAVAGGFKESSEQMFTHTASLKALKTFMNDQGDYFEILTAYGDGGGISADYFWNYSAQENTILVERSDRCMGDSIGCTHANNSVEGIISDKNKKSNYYLAFGNQQKSDIDLGFVDTFTSTFQFK
ncbi:hypothetical protein PV379_04605 [Streptomyces caniscabiei]|uniref:hypothetical protein n=1 Tax=Streptomyces caniscabiei TaxID=2746961 RepID=UPI0029ADFFCE|nr:hypothetical protein [Streptomyces caniscabiei]MDX2776617.1 hypothetical protein [Streptomyces caniscabiei]